MRGVKMNKEKTERYLKIGLFGALLTLFGDCLIGAAKFPDGANMMTCPPGGRSWAA